jgi:translation initiation factor 2B subunit (eIF-2B alpha/beta/delta family)
VKSDWQEEIGALANDHLSPSSALASRAAELLKRVAKEEPEQLPPVARAVVRAQPAMAAIVNVANVAVRALEALGAQSVGPALQALARGVDADRKAAAETLCQRVDGPVRVVTTSASANVVEVLQVLRREDLLEEVVCGESRPLLEGTALARWLADQGYDTILVPDVNLAEHLVPGAIFVVGADAILPAHVANKSGTRLYAAWARLANVERYVLATRDKIYPPDLVACFENPARPAEEILKSPPPRLRVENRAFDLTPREMWTEVLVGAQPASLAEQSGDRALAHGLQPLLED